jgi:hypothetical protein
MTETLFCTACGAEVAATAKFCKSCGVRQEPVEPGPPPEFTAIEREVPAVDSGSTAVDPGMNAATLELAGAKSDVDRVPAFCTGCGRAFSGPQATFCAGCGAARRPTGEETGATRPSANADWQSALPAPFNAAPPELLLVCGLMAIAGIFTLWSVLKILPDIFDLFGAGSLGRSLAFLSLAIWLALGFFGAACLLLAWRMGHADRVARGLSYVLLGGLGGAIIIGNDHGTLLILVMLTCFGAIAILAAAPGVQRFFMSEGAPQSDQPTSVVIARTLVAVWAGFLTLVGLMFLPIGALGSKFVVVGVLFLAIAAAAFVLNRRLAERDVNARVIVSIGCVIYPVLLLVLGQRDPSLLLPLALVGGIVWNLWVPPDAQEFFAGAHPSVASR